MSAKSSDKKPGPVEGASRHSGEGERSSARDAQGPAPSDRDVAIVCGVSDDGQGVDIIRKRGERIETGTVRRLEQGKPIHGEVVRLRPREQSPMICDVEVEVPAPGRAEAPPATSGPAQVATESYRKNWDAVYGQSRKPRSLLN